MRLVPCSPPERRIAPAGSRLPVPSPPPPTTSPPAPPTPGGRSERPGAPPGGAGTHLEAFGRLIAGLAPWLDVPADGTAEGPARAQYAALARRALASAVDPASPDFMNFTRDRQPLVDAAFLAHGCCAHRGRWSSRWSRRRAAAHRRARVDARDRARLQQLAAVLRDGRSRAREARRVVGSAARGLRAAPARAVVQGRRRLRRRARSSTGTTTTASSSSR